MNNELWSRVSTSRTFDSRVVYSYYAENIHRSDNKTVVPYHVFKIVFPHFLAFGNHGGIESPVQFKPEKQPVFYSEGSIFRKIKEYFEKKFGTKQTEKDV